VVGFGHVFHVVIGYQNLCYTSLAPSLASSLAWKYYIEKTSRSKSMPREGLSPFILNLVSIELTELKT
jgi:hypothetical protein